MKNNISLEEAQGYMLEYCQPKEKEYIPLAYGLGRVLGEDLEAKDNIPPFPRSPYDGYALMAQDTAEATEAAPAVLNVIGEIPAGYFLPSQRVNTRKAVKILTGAPVPEGANTVIPYEKTKIDGDKLYIFAPAKAGKDIVPIGEDVSKGELLVKEGTLITPPLIGLLASLGETEILVYKRPKIAIVNIGDELLEVSEPLVPGKIHDSNSYTLANYCRELGADPVVVGTARDRVEDVAALIKAGLEIADADMVITTGGASVGDYDVTSQAVSFVGAEMLYWKIEIKPGSPALAGVKDGRIVLGLSGNPAAAIVTFQLTAAAAIKKMAGRNDYFLHKVDAFLKSDFSKSSPTRRFLRGHLLYEGGKLFVDAAASQGNGVLHSMISCDVLAEIPKGSGPVKAGQKLTAYLLD